MAQAAADERRRAVDALRLLGPASVRLLAVEGDVLVLEHVLPVTPAAVLPDDERTTVPAGRCRSCGRRSREAAGCLTGWGLVRAVLAEAWHVQDTGAPHGAPLAVAEALAYR